MLTAPADPPLKPDTSESHRNGPGEVCGSWNPSGSIDNAASDQLYVGVVQNREACLTACCANANCELAVFFTETYPVSGQRNNCFLKWNLGMEYSLNPGTTDSIRRVTMSDDVCSVGDGCTSTTDLSITVHAPSVMAWHPHG